MAAFDPKSDIGNCIGSIHSPKMVDRIRRDLAARLTREFRAGSLTNDELEDGWPQSPDDRALIAIGTMLWRFYDDHRAHVLKHSDWTDAELGRYAAFLDTDLPYEWSEDRFDKIDWSAMIPFASAMPWVVSRRKRIEEARRLEGDPDAWPFIRAADMDGAAIFHHAHDRPRPVADFQL